MLTLPDDRKRASPGRRYRNLGSQDLHLFAWTILLEAAREPWEGQLGVAYVIMNRLKTGYRGKTTLEQVILDPWQFSCWNDGAREARLRQNRMAGIVRSSEGRRCIITAITAFDELAEDPTKGARHYHATYVSPSWADPGKITLRAGAHIFYKGIA